MRANACASPQRLEPAYLKRTVPIVHLTGLRLLDGFGNESEAERTDYFSNGIEFRFRCAAQRFVETLPGKTCCFRDLCHALGSGDRIEGIANKLGIVGRKRFRKEVSHRPWAFKIICRIEFFDHLLLSLSQFSSHLFPATTCCIS